jgi:hypothetical protein
LIAQHSVFKFFHDHSVPLTCSMSFSVKIFSVSATSKWVRCTKSSCIDLNKTIVSNSFMNSRDFALFVRGWSLRLPPSRWNNCVRLQLQMGLLKRAAFSQGDVSCGGTQAGLRRRKVSWTHRVIFGCGSDIAQTPHLPSYTKPARLSANNPRPKPNQHADGVTHREFLTLRGRTTCISIPYPEKQGCTVCTHIAHQVRGTPAVVVVVEALNVNLTNPMTTTTIWTKHVDHGDDDDAGDHLDGPPRYRPPRSSSHHLLYDDARCSSNCMPGIQAAKIAQAVVKAREVQLP